MSETGSDAGRYAYISFILGIWHRDDSGTDIGAYPSEGAVANICLDSVWRMGKVSGYGGPDGGF